MGLLSRLYNFTAGTPIVADQVDAEFDQILAVLNGSVDSANIADGSIGLADLATAVKNSSLKLAVAADRKLTWGRTGGAAFAFTSAGDILDVSIPHGLGVTPVIYGGWQANGGHFSSGVQMYVSSGPADATNISLRGVCTRQPAPPIVGCDAFWIAIG